MMVKQARKTNFMMVQVRKPNDSKNWLWVFDFAKPNWISSPIKKEFAAELVDFTYN